MFNIGDKVRCTKTYDGKSSLIGKVGKVIGRFAGEVGVEFEHNFDGHKSLYTSGNGKDGHCWNFPDTFEYLELVKEEVKVKNKFEVGQRYIVDIKFEVGESGNTIEITGVDGIWIAYKTVKSKRDGYEFHTSSFGNTSTFGETLKLLSKKQNKLIITNDGTTTTAVLRNGKTVLEKATAICCPTDEFSTYEGARIALARLFDEEPFPVTRDVEKADVKESTELAVGDRVSYEGKHGTIIIDEPSACFDQRYLVEFDKPSFEFHSACGRGKRDHCYWCSTDELTRINSEKVENSSSYGVDTKEQDFEINVGDRVRHVHNARFGNGTVIVKQGDCLVEFDDYHDDLHDGRGSGKKNRCWYCSSSYLIKLQDEKTNQNLLPKTVKRDRYQIGDKVLIVSKWVRGCYANGEGKMDKWLGKIMTIREVDKYNCHYRMEEDIDDGDGWYWRNPCIVGKIVTEKPVVKADSNTIYVGDIIKIVDDSDGRFKIGELYVTAESRPVKMGCIVKHPRGTIDGKAFLYPSEFEVVNVKTVNRKPVKGDLVRIGEHRGYSFATKGDVVRVNNVFGDHFTVLGDEFNYDDGIKEWNFSFSEAVVLEEDCTPKYRKVDRPAKVGDKIRIVEPWLTNGRYKENDVFTVSDDVSCCGAVKVEELGNYNIAHQEYVVLEQL